MSDRVDDWYSATVNVFSKKLTPEGITGALGLAPSTTRRLGDPVSSRRPEGPFIERHRWSLHSPLDDDKPLDEHVAALLDILAAVGDRFREVATDCDSELLIGLSSHPLGRIHEFDAATIRRIAHLGLSIRLDVYDPMLAGDQ